MKQKEVKSNAVILESYTCVLFQARFSGDRGGPWEETPEKAGRYTLNGEEPLYTEGRVFHRRRKAMMKKNEVWINYMLATAPVCIQRLYALRNHPLDGEHARKAIRAWIDDLRLATGRKAKERQ